MALATGSTSANKMGNVNVIDRRSPIPLYYQLAKSLESEILSGKYQANDKFPTDMELAERFDVSRITVRQALNELIAKDLLVRERGRGTFVRPSISCPVAEKRVIKYRRLGLIMPWGPGTFFAPMLDAIEDSAHNKGFHVMLANNREDPEIEITRVRELLNHGVDGVLWMCPTKGPNYSIAKKLINSVPVVVCIDRFPDFPDIEVNLVEADHYSGMRKVISHLVESGRKKIAFVREPLEVNAIFERVRGYRDGLKEAGIEAEDNLIFTSRKLFRENGEICARKILKSSEHVDAICCCTDSTAIGVIHTLRNSGIRIPEQMAVTGFNDDPIAVAVRPQLTTVHQDVASLGRKAVELLISQLETLERGEQVARTKLRVPVELVVRESG